MKCNVCGNTELIQGTWCPGCESFQEQAALPQLIEALKNILPQACENGCPEYWSNDGDMYQEHTDECKAAHKALALAGVEGGK